MTIRETLAKDWPVLLILAFPFVLIGFVWDQIPEQIAMHWNIRGEVDGWGEKGFDVFFLPLINLGVYLLLLFIPYIDPKRKADHQQKALRAFRFILPVIFTGLFVLMLLQWLGYDFGMNNMVYLAIAFLFLLMGNYLQSLKPNYFIGIRTPWTLENEDIWRKTHRMGGKVWMIVSLILIALWFFVPTASFSTVFFIGVLTIVLIPTGYSFYLYMKGRKPAESA